MRKVVALVVSLMSGALRADNPVIWADVPDISMIRAGDFYYMSSTTMHMSPGVPIMKSGDLVNWNLVGYACDRLVENEKMNLSGGQNCYGAGSWASSLRYHNGTYYVSTFSSTSGRTHVYTTKDIEKGPWMESSFRPALHDHSLFFDEGRVYMVYGGGEIRIKELTADATAVKPGGLDQIIIKNASDVAGGQIGLPAEGSQIFKVNGRYYLFNITWPRGGMRTAIVHRADTITGPYEGRVALRDQGVAQGGIIDTPDGKWYAYMFQDHGAVGRVPYIVPMRWEEGWPVLGVEGKVPMTLELSGKKQGLGNIVISDEFERSPGERDLPPAWQWNHNPDPQYWSLQQRPGWLRLTTGRIDSDVTQARNTLTQRTFGPVCSAATAIDVSRMKEGDVAGLMLLQKNYGLVGVKAAAGGKSIVMLAGEGSAAGRLDSVPLDRETLYFKVDCDFRENQDRAFFYYSMDGKNWKTAGKPLQMRYTLPHFMGYRFALFNYATQAAGGSADFDYFRIQDELRQSEHRAESKKK
jgi:beta-xylosidase